VPDRRRSHAYLFFLAAFALLVVLIHLPLLDLPFHWDEGGQFIPAALDLYQRGLWVPHSATPNVHPPGLMVYLALVWRVFGFSVTATRVAMLALAAVALWVVFLLAIRLCRRIEGAPALAAVLLLAVSPLFYTQAMLAQLDMPAMLFTSAALLLFLRDRIRWAALASLALVMVKETGIVVPLVLAGWLIVERRARQAAWFLLPVAALGAWLAVLFKTTGTIFGNPEFGRYNVGFALHPVRMAIALARRGFYLFLDQFHWIGWLAVVVAWRRADIYKSRSWMVALTVGVAQVLAVTAFGGATLERYLLPALPLMYIAFAAAWSATPSLATRIGQVGLFAGLLLFLFWNPPYPYPFENNLAMVDFVHLHESAAGFLERTLPGAKVTTAWPLSVELRRPSLGYVRSRMAVTEIPGFRPVDIEALKPGAVEVFVLFSRDWEGEWDPRQMRVIGGLMRRFYGYQPQVAPEELERRLHLKEVVRWNERGQWIAVFRSAASR
jgi:4-amino-4-deoxy-L-arabinose transferase-like glycosyltransferase